MRFSNVDTDPGQCGAAFSVDLGCEGISSLAWPETSDFMGALITSLCIIIHGFCRFPATVKSQILSE